MKKLISLLLCVMMSVGYTACSAANTDEGWKNNTGKIDLDKMSVSGSGVSVTNGDIVITQGGDFEVSGAISDGMIYVSSEEKVKLRLSGASITNSDGPAIYFDNAEKALITITEGTENYLTDGKTYSDENADGALFSNDDLEIKGDGTLTISGNYKHGIAGDDDVVIENGNINITSYEHGIKANDKLWVSGGKITAKAETGKPMKAGTELIVDGGTLDLTSTQSEGMESKGTLTINGGDISVTAADDGINTGNENTATGDAANGGQFGGARSDMMQQGSFDPNAGGQQPQFDGQQPQMQGGQQPQFDGQQPPQMPNGQQPQFDGQQPQMPNGQQPQFDGQQPPQMPDGQQPQFDGQQPQMPNGQQPDMGGAMPSFEPGQRHGGMRGGGGGFGMIDEEIAAAHAITINGGKIYVNAGGDGIDSNGNLTINGGELTVDGPTNSGNGALDAEGTFAVNGGTIIAASAAGMNQNPSACENQPYAAINLSASQTAGAEVSIRETASGNEVMKYAPSKAYQTITYSSDKLKAGAEYAVYVDGEQAETFTAQNGINQIGTAAFGMFGGRGSMRHGQNQEITVFVNGGRVNFPVAPVTRNDTTLVGFRAILEALGANVTWDDATQTATAEKDGAIITMTIGSTTATVNGQAVEMLAAPELVSDSTLIPVRFISENLGMTVDWDEQTKQINIH